MLQQNKNSSFLGSVKGYMFSGEKKGEFFCKKKIKFKFTTL